MRVAPAEAGHLLFMGACADPALRLTLRSSAYRLIQAQLAFSEAYAIFESERRSTPFALVGGTMLPTGEMEIWFLVRPGGLAASLLLQVVRFGRALLAKRPPAVCYVAAGNQSGVRLARLLGFEKSTGVIGQLEEWKRPHG